ncbi:MAG: hypothetical protein V1859_04645 [archaeon]
MEKAVESNIFEFMLGVDANSLKFKKYSIESSMLEFEMAKYQILDWKMPSNSIILRNISSYYTIQTIEDKNHAEKNDLSGFQNNKVEHKGSNHVGEEGHVKSDDKNVLDESEPNIDAESEPEKINKNIIFSNPNTVRDHTINEIIDAFAKIGMSDPAFISRINDDSLTRLLVLFNKWINIDIRQEEIFSNITPKEEESLQQRFASEPSRMLSYSQFSPQHAYSNAIIFGETGSSSLNYQEAQNEPSEGLYNRIEKSKMENSEDNTGNY